MTRGKPTHRGWPFWFARKPKPDSELDRIREAALQAYLELIARLLPLEDRPLAGAQVTAADPLQARVSAMQRQRRSDGELSPTRSRRDGPLFEFGPEEQATARIQTLALLQELDGARKGVVIRFLYRSGLIGKEAAIRLEGADLDGINLAQADLWGVNLDGARLRAANLSEARLSGATLQHTDLREAILSGADLWAADLLEADLTFSKAGQANLGNANLSRAYLCQAGLQEIDLSGATLALANLALADLRKARLRKADLRQAILWGSRLDGADLSGADLSGADLKGAILDWANLTGARLRRATVTPEQLAAAVSLEGAMLPDGKVRE
jgi:uncharacterized protein YjbI with pentapeptide repeats